MIIGAIILLIVSIFTVKKEKEKIEEKRQLLTCEKESPLEEIKKQKENDFSNDDIDK